MPQQPLTEQPEAPGRRRPPRILFRVLNPLFTMILRWPLHRLLSGRLMLLRFTGRKTGRRFTLVVGYAQVDDTLLVGTESAWKTNLRAAVPVQVRLRGRERFGTAEVVSDEEGMTELYRTMLSVAPGYGRAINVRLDADGTPNRADVARARSEGHVVVRICLSPG